MKHTTLLSRPSSSPPNPASRRGESLLDGINLPWSILEPRRKPKGRCPDSRTCRNSFRSSEAASRSHHEWGSMLDFDLFTSDSQSSWRQRLWAGHTSSGIRGPHYRCVAPRRILLCLREGGSPQRTASSRVISAPIGRWTWWTMEAAWGSGVPSSCLFRSLWGN